MDDRYSDQPKRKWSGSEDGVRKRWPEDTAQEHAGPRNGNIGLVKMSPSTSRFTPVETPLYAQRPTSPVPYSTFPPDGQAAFAGEHFDARIAKDAQELADAHRYSPPLPSNSPYFVKPRRAEQYAHNGLALPGIVEGPVFGRMQPSTHVQTRQPSSMTLPAYYPESNPGTLPSGQPPGLAKRSQIGRVDPPGGGNPQPVRNFPTEQPPALGRSSPGSVIRVHGGYLCCAGECIFLVQRFETLEELNLHCLSHAQNNGRQPIGGGGEHNGRLPKSYERGSGQEEAWERATPSDQTTERSMLTPVAPTSSAATPSSSSELGLSARQTAKLMQMVAEYPFHTRDHNCFCAVPGCKEAQKPFDNVSNLRKHQRWHIPYHQWPIVCDMDDCIERFLFPAYMKNHQDTEHRKLVCYCQVCGQVSKRYDNLVGRKRHMDTFHPGMPKPDKATARMRPVMDMSTSSSPLGTASSRGHGRREGLVQTPVGAGQWIAPSAARAPRQYPSNAELLSPGFDPRRLDTALAHDEGGFKSRSPSPVRARASASSSSRRTSSAWLSTPVGRSSAAMSAYSPSSVPGPGTSFMESDGFSRPSPTSAASTAPTSVSASTSSSRLWSHVAAEAARKPAMPPTPTPMRHMSPATPSRAARLPSASRISPVPEGRSRRSADLPYRTKPSDYGSGGSGFSSSPRK
ncbi:hypothetical protein LTR53_005885 [Teratosphaeriaceae sp. CCFEE 6253]|nr:hypothetical protein LTR53_005885 [Teratosphaeriaceae sp. CCFEE 6253]